MRLVVVAFLMLVLPTVSAEVLRAGEDPAGDSKNEIAPGVDVGSQISPARTDIRYLEFEDQGERMLVRLGLGAVPAGTSGYMYRAVFDVGSTRYFTCYNVQWTGGQSAANQENVLGCSRFTSNTAVGPVTTAAGVIVADNAITWPVAKSAIGGAGLGDLTAAFADTWFRGISNCCVGSTTNSQYLWNQADRGPDADLWVPVYAPPAPPAPSLSINITSDVNRTAAPPGGWARFVLNITATEAINFTLAIDGLGWHTTGLGNLTLGNLSMEQELILEVPADANGTFIFEVQALVDGNVTTRLELIVDADPAATGYIPPGHEASPIDGGDEEEADDESPAAKDTPLPVVVAVAALLWTARRRR